MDLRIYSIVHNVHVFGMLLTVEISVDKQVIFVSNSYTPNGVCLV